jgi:N-acetylmuramoyl-L-alanine amidase
MYRKEDEAFYTMLDARLLALLVHGEADNQEEEGKIGVMSVILNRVTKGGWFIDKGIDSVLERHLPSVILKNALVKGKFIYQFSCFQEGDPNRDRLLQLASKQKVDLQYVALAEKVLTGEIKDNVSGALYYYADYIKQPSWAKNMLVTKKIGVHIFLKEK